MSVLPFGAQWRAHCGKKAQLRNLKHLCKPVLDDHRPHVQVILERLWDAVKEEPEPTFGFLHLIHAAIDASDQTGETWATAMGYLLDQFDNMKADHLEAQTGGVKAVEDLHEATT